MSSLPDLQHAFQRALLEDASDFARCVVGSADLPAGDRIDVYRDAYRLRLREGLGANYPRLQQLLGEHAFTALADSYIDAHPSRTPSIRWFGDQLAGELRSAFPAQPWLAELAEWEWIVAAAFDAEDAQRVSSAHLGEVEHTSWPHLRFKFHPSVRCVCMQTNAPILFKALSEESPLPEPTTIAEAPWLVWRDDLTTRFRSLTAGELCALNMLMRGECFEAVCTELCAWYAPEEVALRAATLLRECVEAGMICEFLGAS